ncbi:MAG: radical SAM protein [Theionarchaea archaeon]|nr:MAG: hypothetical protein AYK18_02530 [Theionarchaea archaeon DG-70]MBU7012131.1 radical SAM protein [Theionarchaea archaeon]
MKSSKYNLFIPTKDSNKYILYNTLQDSILVADFELKELLENNKFDDLTEEHLDVLKTMKILVDDGLDEKKVLSFRYCKEKYSSPYSIFVIFPTLACNLACKYCYERTSELSARTMDEKTVVNTISFIKKMAAEDNTRTILIKLYGGEPLLNVAACTRICEEVSSWAQQLGMQVAVVLQTNGTLLTEDVLDALAPYLTYVELTVDGPQKNHDTIRIYKDGSGTYQDIMSAMERVTKRGIHTALRINIRNEDDLRDVLTDLTERGFREKRGVTFYYAQTSSFGLCELFSNNKLCHDDEERALEMSPAVREVIKELKWMEHLEMPDILQKQKFVACNNEKKARYVIDPYGDIYLCFFRAGQKEYRAGTLTEGEGQFGSMYYEMLARNPLQFEECRTCVYLPLCGGGCAMRAYEQSGTFHTNSCGSMKDFAEKRILMYLKRKYPDRFEKVI